MSSCMTLLLQLQAENDRLRARLSNKYVDNDYSGESSISDCKYLFVTITPMCLSLLYPCVCHYYTLVFVTITPLCFFLCTFVCVHVQQYPFVYLLPYVCQVLCHVCVTATLGVCHYIVQHEKTRRQLEDKLSYSEGIIMTLQKENHKFQEDILRLKSERSRLQNKVMVSY